MGSGSAPVGASDDVRAQLDERLRRWEVRFRSIRASLDAGEDPASVLDVLRTTANDVVITIGRVADLLTVRALEAE